jgi:hypothetical protein
MFKAKNNWSAPVAGACDPGIRPASLRPATARRGVLLLVVLSLLVLFSLIAVTFVLVAGSYYDAAKNSLKVEQTGDDPKQLLDEVLAQCIRGSTNPHSVIGPHGLLEDLYGNDGIKYNNGTALTINQTAVAQLLDIRFTPSSTYPIYLAAYPSTAVPATAEPPEVPLTTPAKTKLHSLVLSLDRLQTPGFFNGCILTALDGAAKGKSTRILGWTYVVPITTAPTPPPPYYAMRIAAFDGVPWGDLNANKPTSFIINGRPFNGTGFGFNPYANVTTEPTLLNAKNSAGRYRALLPNPVFFKWDGQSPQFGGIGGADEDYDAPDPQNMLLAHVSLNASTGGIEPAIIPSLHRPETISYLNAPTDPETQLRPLATDHPQFPPLVDADNDKIPDSYDIDNDGDGVTDSIWVDAGLPVRTAADGRMYKPMVAVLCLDLDGRLNVNAHGTLVQVNPNYPNGIPTGTGLTASISNYLYSTSGTAATVPLPRGLGFGPAEINLNVLFANLPGDYQQFFKGGTINNVVYEGRYGESDYAATNIFSNPVPGHSLDATGPDDQLVKIKRYGTPAYYFGMPSQYGSPGDMWGRSAMGLDYSGQPVYSYLPANRAEQLPTGTNLHDPETPNDPYSINLTRARAVQNAPTKNDNLFSVAELERVLRLYDNDAASLPDRLRTLLNPVGTSKVEVAKLITTDSNDLAVPGAPVSRDVAVSMKTKNGAGGGFSGSASFLDIVRTRLMAIAGYTSANVNTPLTDLVTKGVIAPELLAGQRFNVNRPFGNGRDDDNDGIVDEAEEYSYNNLNEVPVTWNGITGFTKPQFMDLNRDGNTAADPQEGYKARVTYAKQLYFLMLTLADRDYLWASDNGTLFTATETELQKQREVTSRRIAQWAINVVDFRDADSIMTPFEYDANPFNGWEVDGLVTVSDPNAMNPDRRVVWGVERPELLLTETLAFHDRRVADETNDSTGSTHSMTSMPPNKDDHYDQVFVPQGSLFLELYCPRSPLSTQAATAQGQPPADLYSSGRLDLGAIAGQSPVWRVAITRSTVQAANMLTNRVQNHRDLGTFDPPIDAATDIAHGSFFDPASVEAQLETERFIWFCNLNPTSDPNPETASHSVFWNQNNTLATLSPGQHAIIGPRLQTSVGFTTAPGNIAANQKIVLDPAGSQVQVFDTAGTANTMTDVLAMVCAGTSGTWPPIGMSVSEPPLSTYYGTIPTNITTGQYSPAWDLPLDGTSVGPANPASPINGLLATGVKPLFRFALLQRLANPKLAFNATTNPYITVDWQAINLTVFNGSPPSSAQVDPDDPSPPSTVAFGSRHRGNVAAPRNIWNATLFTDAVTSTATDPNAVFGFAMTNTLGYVNPAFGTRWNPPPTGDLKIYSQMPQPAATQPFTYPWLTWNNRPYISGAELMLVPAASAEQMLRYFSAPATPATSLATSAYQPAAPSYYLPFGHLFNFRQSGNGAAGSGTNYARVLEYLSVASPYIGHEEYINTSTPIPAANGAPTFMAPFNVISDNREPGRININTIPGSAGLPPISLAWEGVRDSLGVAHPAPAWKDIVVSRRGDAIGPQNVTSPTSLSTYFARPFRSAAGAAYSLPGAFPTGTTPNEVEATMLRQSAKASPPPGPSGRGLFENTTNVGIGYADPVANAYFHHQPAQRLSNLLTTRSNVYAIWLTVGYFEVRPAATSGPGTPYPDGYELMQEIGSDTGEIVRHRAFYIYDRSIPVGFERGKDHNFADGLLLKRFIE